MKQEFENAYRSLFYEYPYYRRIAFPDRPYMLRSERDLLEILRNSIIRLGEQSVENTGLRSDALYFLLINFHHMIIRPLAESDNIYSTRYLQEEQENILSDLSTVINLALEQARERPVSGHTILETINSSWKSLKTTRLSLWGDDKRTE
jgi:hypothetical protein